MVRAKASDGGCGDNKNKAIELASEQSKKLLATLETVTEGLDVVESYMDKYTVSDHKYGNGFLANSKGENRFSVETDCGNTYYWKITHSIQYKGKNGLEYNINFHISGIRS